MNSLVNYFHTRQLIRWLRANRYAEELAAVEKLSANENNLAQKLGAIFGFEIPPDEIPDDGGDIVKLLNYLKQFTDDKKLLAQIEQEVSEGTAFVARNQTELNDDIAQYFDKIYLVQGEFVIPLDKTNKIYIGIGDKVIAIIQSEKFIDFDKLNIKFNGICFNDDYQKIIDATNKPEKGTNLWKKFPRINWDDPKEFINPRLLTCQKATSHTYSPPSLTPTTPVIVV